VAASPGDGAPPARQGCEVALEERAGWRLDQRRRPTARAVLRLCRLLLPRKAGSQGRMWPSACSPPAGIRMAGSGGLERAGARAPCCSGTARSLRNRALTSGLSAGAFSPLPWSCCPHSAPQSRLDVLSSQSQTSPAIRPCCCRRELDSLLPHAMTAAGTVQPAKVWCWGGVGRLAGAWPPPAASARWFKGV